MIVSDQVSQLMQEGRLLIELEAAVLGTHIFKANGRDVAMVTVKGNPGGPMGQGVECIPNGIFELDAEMGVYREIGEITEPQQFKFRADLKSVNTKTGYVVHLLQVIR